MSGVEDQRTDKILQRMFMRLNKPAVDGLENLGSLLQSFLTGDGSKIDSTVIDGSSLIVQEEDGLPTGTPSTLKFPNGTVTDNGDGSFSVASGSGSDSLELIMTNGDSDFPEIMFDHAGNVMWGP